MPVRGVERQVTADRSKVSLVAGDQGRPDATRRERDQDVEGQLADLAEVIALTESHSLADLGGVDPVPLSRRDDATLPLQGVDEIDLG
jgi:hypothetical protein